MKLKFAYKGGPGSGFHGHQGRPGKQGGAAPAGSEAAIADQRADEDKARAAQADMEEAARKRDAVGFLKAKRATKLAKLEAMAKSKFSKATEIRPYTMGRSLDMSFKKEDFDREALDKFAAENGYKVHEYDEEEGEIGVRLENAVMKPKLDY